ncbi:hypothetical protein OIO90_006139 [Microbotryomycetes sp. JL221]|nr:hypothetical protein OIO90_006139 [Microbotryomycetes sp. JL221]
MSGFLKSLAHTPKVSLGPKDLQQLQNVISSEKRVAESSSRSSAELTKAANSLKEWANTEGPDIADVVTKIGILFDYLSGSEKRYSEHHENYRLHFKNIRTREEDLAQLKRNRDSLGSKIEAQDKKVSRMKEENKDLPTAMQRLSEMRQEMVGLENSVLNEETNLGDKKREIIKMAMSLRLGALLEWAEKAVVVAELGKLIVDELPTDRTEPGTQRAPYNGYNKTDDLMQQAQKCISDVVFNPQPLQDQYGAAAHHAGQQVGQSQQQLQQQQGDWHQAPYGQEGFNGANGAGAGGSYNNNTFGSQQHQPYHSTTNEESYKSNQHYQQQQQYDSYGMGTRLPEIVPSGGLGVGESNNKEQSRPSSLNNGTYGLAAAAIGSFGGNSSTQGLNDKPGVAATGPSTTTTSSSLTTPAYMTNRSSLAYMEEDQNARKAWEQEQSLRERHSTIEDTTNKGEDEGRNIAQGRGQQVDVGQVALSDSKLNKDGTGPSNYERQANQVFEAEQRELKQIDGEGERGGRKSFENQGIVATGATNLSPVNEENSSIVNHSNNVEQELNKTQPIENQDYLREKGMNPSFQGSNMNEGQGSGIPYSVGPPRYNQYHSTEANERPYVPYEGDGNFPARARSTTPGGSSTAVGAAAAAASSVSAGVGSSLPPGAGPSQYGGPLRGPPPRILTATPPPTAINTALPSSPAINTPLSPAAAAAAAASSMGTRETMKPNVRQPVIIRGESALGTKHGDVFVPNRAAIDGGALNTSNSNPSTPNGTPGMNNVGTSPYGYGGNQSGYFNSSTPIPPPSSSSTHQIDSQGRRIVTAGAFRRPNEPSNNNNNNHSKGFVGTSLGSPRYGSMSEGLPSQADVIREQYLNAQMRAIGGEGQDGFDVLSSTGAGGGGGAPSPRFDVSPLQVNKPKALPTRVGSVPPGADTSYSTSSPPPQQQREYQPLLDTGRPSSRGPPAVVQGNNMAGVGSGTMRPPSYVSPPSTELDPTSASQTPGFGQQQFVTRLD